VTAGHRSIHPRIPGVPWWAAVVMAATATAVGFAFDAGSGKELTHVFAALYVSGCVAAVFTVRQSALFTAVIQPPLILFFSVPGAYWLFHGAKITSLKDILINCGYPLIERFPLMLFTSAGVLLIGMVRWYAGMTAHATANATSGKPRTGITAKLASIWNRVAGREADATPPTRSRRVHAVGHSPKSSKSDKIAGGAGQAKRPAPTRSRHVRPPLDDKPEPAVERARRRRSRPDFEAAGPPAPRRRPRVPRDPDLRGQPPREIRRDPHVRSDRPTKRSSRFDPYEPMEPAEPLQPYEPLRPPAPKTADSTAATHHPISRVRYRGSAGDDEAHTDRRTRGPRKSSAESWEYDI
jgi:hypothetical protein